MFRQLITVSLLLAGSFVVLPSEAQPLSKEVQKQMVAREDTLLVLSDSMYHAFIPDRRPEYCERFVRTLVRTLRTDSSFSYDFPRLREKINIIAPDNKSFRIFNWLVVSAPHQVRYYGAVQMPDAELKLYPLIDCTSELGKSAEDSILRNARWYGALYYRIVTTEADGQKIYTLFGMNSSSPISNKKVMDPLQITDSGLVFGAPVFNVSSAKTQQRINRFIIEYNKEVQASLNWDEEKQMVYFDKLVSQVNDPRRKYTYVPSGEYDGFRWYDGRWNYISDLIPIQKFKDGEAPAPAPLKAKE